MSQEEFQRLSQFFKILADENMLKLLGILANGERSVEELATFLELQVPTVSHHLAKLREFDLLNLRVDGNTHYYGLNVEALNEANKRLLTPEHISEPADDFVGDDWERKVLKDFFEGSRLKEIPVNRKKRGVVLRWLAQQFAYDVKYKESEVNEILRRHYPYISSLRRELISMKYALMTRKDGLYWRVQQIESTPFK